MFMPVLGGLFEKQVIGRSEGEYMTRFHLTPWKWWPFKKRLYLHGFRRPDRDEHPHDHPFPFRSIILWGGYTEKVFPYKEMPGGGILALHPNQPTLIRRRWLRSHRAEAGHVHMIAELHAKTVWTLVIREPKVQEWGFYVWTFKSGVVKVPWWQYIGLPAKPPAAYGE